MTQPNHREPDIEPLTRTQVLVVMGVTAVILLAIAKIWQYLGSVTLLPVHLNLKAFGIGISMAVGIAAISGAIYRLWPAYRRSAQYYLELVLKPLVWSDLIWLGLLPGLSEELLFRGVMIPAFGSGVVAIALSSILFGILHTSGIQQWPYVVWATVVGLILGIVAVVTGNLLIPIVAHVCTNLVSSCLWKLEH